MQTIDLLSTVVGHPLGCRGEMPWQMFKKADAPVKVTRDLSAPAEDEKFSRIRCPRCQWQPRASDQWVCWSGDGPEPPFDACGTAWNTFATRGRCPGCAHQWTWTSCLRCDRWSPHEDWYEEYAPPGGNS